LLAAVAIAVADAVAFHRECKMLVDSLYEKEHPLQTYLKLIPSLVQEEVVVQYLVLVALNEKLLKSCDGQSLR